MATCIADNLHLGILHGTDAVDNVAEAGNTRCECAANVSINECQLGCLVEVFVVHVVDKVECVDIHVAQPFHHVAEARLQFLPCQVLAGDWAELWTALFACLGIHTAVDGIEQGLCQIGACTEELHFLTCLSGRYAAADAVVIAPDGTHHIVVFILNRARLHGNPCGITLERLRQTRRIEHGEVGLRRGTHVDEGVEEAVPQ